MLNEFALQDSRADLNRRIKHYVRPQLLHRRGRLLSNDTRYDLLFEVVRRRYEGFVMDDRFTRPRAAHQPRP